MSPVSRLGFWAGPLACISMLLLGRPPELAPEAWATVSVTLWVAVWWSTEAIPLAATALLPLVLFPLTGAGTMGEVASSYVSPSFFLLLGGSLIALAMQRCHLHRRIALAMLLRTGIRPPMVIASFMLTSALLSLWISNTATTLMILPTALSVAAVVAPRADSDPDQRQFRAALALGVAYASSVGGVGTLVGTPPNLLLAGHLYNEYGIDLTFADWIPFGMPLVALMLPAAWVVLTKVSFRFRLEEAGDARAVVRGKLDELGALSGPERRTLAVIIAVACCWMFRAALNQIPGLETLSDTSIAIAGALALFVIPSGRQGRLLNAESVRRVSWDVLILYGGALALAAGISRSGLTEALSRELAFAADWPAFWLIAMGVTAITFWTELVQNSAALAMFLPVIAAVSAASGADPLQLAIPVTMATSYAFMHPVATPPNTIVYGSGAVTMREMARAGLILNVLGILAITLLSRFYFPWLAR